MVTTKSKEKKILEIEKAIKIRGSTLKSLNHLLNIYKMLKADKKGTSTDEQQDLLRATIVLGCAGLDSFLKQIVNDALKNVRKNDKASQKFFIEKTRIILKSPKEDALNLDIMSQILMSGKPDEVLADIIMKEMSGKSLQSYPELGQVAKSFGMGEDFFSDKKEEITKLFETRNNIAHSFDYRFKRGKNDSGEKVRVQRKFESTVEMNQTVIYIMDRFIAQVKNILK